MHARTQTHTQLCNQLISIFQTDPLLTLGCIPSGLVNAKTNKREREVPAYDTEQARYITITVATTLTAAAAATGRAMTSCTARESALLCPLSTVVVRASNPAQKLSSCFFFFSFSKLNTGEN
jgi:hypothetical protein